MSETTTWRCVRCYRISIWLGEPGACPSCQNSMLEPVTVLPLPEAVRLRGIEARVKDSFGPLPYYKTGRYSDQFDVDAYRAALLGKEE